MKRRNRSPKRYSPRQVRDAFDINSAQLWQLEKLGAIALVMPQGMQPNPGDPVKFELLMSKEQALALLQLTNEDMVVGVISVSDARLFPKGTKMVAANGQTCIVQEMMSLTTLAVSQCL